MTLTGQRVAVLVEQQYQEMEVWYPVYRLREAGCEVTLVGPEAGKTYPSKLGYPAVERRWPRRMPAPTIRTRSSSPAASRPTTSAAASRC